MRAFWTACGIVYALVVWFWLSMITVHGQPPAEGAMVTLPLPEIAGMTGEQSYILAANRLSLADHEGDEGYANIGKLGLSVPPDSTAADILRSLKDADVELVIRVKAKRELEQVVR